MNHQLTWVIDWNKITKWEDLKELLQCIELYPIEHHPQFYEIKKFCKLIDNDGKTVNQTESTL